MVVGAAILRPMRAFHRSIGIDYSGVETPTADRVPTRGVGVVLLGGLGRRVSGVGVHAGRLPRRRP